MSTYTDRDLITMVELNARAMTRQALDAGWRNAFDRAATVEPERRSTWEAIRHIYAVELDMRDRIEAWQAQG